MNINGFKQMNLLYFLFIVTIWMVGKHGLISAVDHPLLVVSIYICSKVTLMTSKIIYKDYQINQTNKIIYKMYEYSAKKFSTLNV